MRDKFGVYITKLMTTIIDKDQEEFVKELAFNELKRLKDKGLQSVSYTLKDKVKVKDKEKLKDKESREKEFFDLVKKKSSRS